MNERLQQALAATGAFTSYVSQYPALFETVLEKCIIVQHTMYSSCVIEVSACRDALASLHMIAREANIPALAATFYCAYELLSLCLMGYWEEMA